MHPPLLDAPAARDRLAAIRDALAPLRPVWEPAAFRALPVPWEQTWPEVGAWMRARTVDEIDALEDDISRVERWPGAPAALVAWERTCRALSALGAWPRGEASPALWSGVSVRKCAQIGRFLDAVFLRDGQEAAPAGEPVVDWCAGKGHLGRTFSLRSGRAVRAMERDPALCASGAAQAREQGALRLSFHQGDALQASGAEALDGAAGALALHACGGLTDALIRGVVARRTPWLAYAPCCYWRVGQEDLYTPRSQAARAHDLKLDRALMRLCCNEERTGPPRVRSERRRHIAWRLALSLLQQEARGTAAPEGLPDGVRELLVLPFRDFCERSAAELGVSLPARWDPARAEAMGWERARVVRGLGLARAPFRRPLELWLVLDRALWLTEAGYTVSVGTFCQPSESPRNLLVQARELSARTPSR